MTLLQPPPSRMPQCPVSRYSVHIGMSPNDTVAIVLVVLNLQRTRCDQKQHNHKVMLHAWLGNILDIVTGFIRPEP